MQIILSDDLVEITAEINVYKQQAGQAVFEIGKRLKHVKDNDLAHGQFGAWLESVGFDNRHAHRYIQAFEQFSPTSGNLSTSKIFEMLSLPESVDRQEFLQQTHTVPSTGEEKKGDDLNVKELREVKKQLKEEQRQREQAEARAIHNEKLWRQTTNQIEELKKSKTADSPETLRRIAQLEKDVEHYRKQIEGEKAAKERKYQEAITQFPQIKTLGYNQDSAIAIAERLRKDPDFYTKFETAANEVDERRLREERHWWEQKEAEYIKDIFSNVSTIARNYSQERLGYWLQHVDGEKRSEIERATNGLNFAVTQLTQILNDLRESMRGPRRVV